jgi:hypothetical protein
MSPEARERSFDELARGLASGSVSRRKALRLMGAALVGSALGSLGGVAAADDECKPLNKKCRKNHQCCSGNCVNSTCAACPSETTPCGTECCTAGESCYRFGIPNTEPICCSNPGCVGFASAAGPPGCITSAASVDICDRTTCNTDADCSGELCVQTPGCPGGGNRCAPAC